MAHFDANKKFHYEKINNFIIIYEIRTWTLQKFIKYVINNTPSNTYLILENTAGQKNELFPDISDFCDFCSERYKSCFEMLIDLMSGLRFRKPSS